MKVSIIVPAYNAEATIKDCIEALLAQKGLSEALEIIVVDDGSSDGTAEIVRGFPITCVHQTNQGPAAARNTGAGEAGGEIILFTDSDCIADQHWVREMTRPFSDPKVVAVKGAYRTGQTGLAPRFAQIEFEERFELLKKAPTIDMVDTYSAGFRKEVFLDMGGFDVAFPIANNEDTELSYRMSSRGLKMVFNPDAIVFHTGHPATVWRYAKLKFSRGYWRMVVYKRFPEKMINDTYTPKTLKLQVLCVLSAAVFLPLTAILPLVASYLFLLSLAAFGALATPFTLVAYRKDPLVGVFSPIMLFIRASSIGLGALWALVRSRS